MIPWICRNEWLCVQLEARVRWDGMIWHILHTQLPKPSGTKKNPSLFVTHQNNFIRSLQPSIYPKHHKYGRHSLAHSKSYHSPRVCHFYVLYPHFAIVSQPTPSNTLTTWHHPQISSTIHPPYPKRLVKVPSSCRCSSLRAPPSAVLRRQAWQPQRKFRRDKRPRRASEGLVEWHNVRPPQKVPTGEMPNLGKFTRGMEHLVYIYI